MTDEWSVLQVRARPVPVPPIVTPHRRSTRRSASPTRMRSSRFSSPSSSAATPPSASFPPRTTPPHPPSPPPSPSSRPSVSASPSLPRTPPTRPPSSNPSTRPPPGCPYPRSPSSGNAWPQCGLPETTRAFFIPGSSGYAPVISWRTSDCSPTT
jgi:hypothetical protein